MFEQSVQNLGNPKYLGSYQVVDGLVRDFVGEAMSAKEIDDVMASAEKFSRIFSGVDASYIQVDNWANRSGLGRALEQHMSIDSSQSLHDMVRTAFVEFASGLMRAVTTAKGDDEKVKPVVDKSIKWFVGVLMGVGGMVKP